MKSKVFVNLVFLLSLSSAILLASCSSTTKLVAPEVEPPADLIPAYLPDGYKLVKGYQLSAIPSERWFDADQPPGDDPMVRVAQAMGKPVDVLNLYNPAGKDVFGVQFQKGEKHLLITKASYPGGSMDLWLSTYAGSTSSNQSGEMSCPPMIIPSLDFRDKLTEVRTLQNSQVAILQGPLGWKAVFVKGDDLLTVQGDISLEEILKIAESLISA